jgi:DNA invertase Pin-like site-specific DNA recombinase
MENKITPDHLRRIAVVYIRQSSAIQLTQNLESQRRQYELAEHAKTLGFIRVELVDEDLGRSGSGLVERPGFQRVVAMVCAGHVGAVLCIEASRLARNGRDWHHLIELCGLTNTLVIDPDGVYNPQLINDRLLLGLKGTMSEFELNLLRQRSLEAARQKARRGELQFCLPAGYCWTHHGKIELEPDERVRQAIARVFSKFTELGSVRRALLWFRSEEVSLPIATYTEFGRTMVWRLPVYGTLHGMLTNPIYAGAYSFGRRTTRIQIIDGKAIRTEGHAKSRGEWMVLIRDHHPGYICWDQYERNQMVIAENAHSKGLSRRKAGRGGQSLLIGLLRCRRCGRMLQVSYGSKQKAARRYHCRVGHLSHGSDWCISFGGLKVDRVVGEEMLKAVSGEAVEAALKAAESKTQQAQQRIESTRLELEQARYEVRIASRRYEAVDPDNRLVAAELESRWNSTLARVGELERSLAELETESRTASQPDREALLRLAKDLPAIWNAPTTDMRLKQRIVRILVEEIVADVDESANQVVLILRWTGGRHSELRIAKNKTGHHRRVTDPEVIEIIRQMAGQYSDEDIAATLNRLKLRTGAGNSWQVHRVQWARSHNGLPAYDPAMTDAASMLTLEQSAMRLHISESSVRKLINEKILPAKQVVFGAPWQIAPESLRLGGVTKAVAEIKGRRYVPQARRMEEQTPLFSDIRRGDAQ